jgi:hypothetical protein
VHSVTVDALSLSSSVLATIDDIFDVCMLVAMCAHQAQRQVATASASDSLFGVCMAILSLAWTKFLPHFHMELSIVLESVVCDMLARPFTPLDRRVLIVQVCVLQRNVREELVDKRICHIFSYHCAIVTRCIVSPLSTCNRYLCLVRKCCLMCLPTSMVVWV